MSIPVEIAPFSAEASERKQRVKLRSSHARKNIWIDLDNSPHVPFFVPIIDELRARGHRVVLTAKDSYQVCDLLKFHHISANIIGRHWGKNHSMKIFGTVFRAAQLMPVIMKEKVDLAVSHGSRAQLIGSLALGIPTITIADYEFAASVGSLKSDWVFLPYYIPDSAAPLAKKQVMKYPGLKEDVYVPRFRPDLSLMNELGLTENDMVVTVRPPATEAHYHNPEAEGLLDAVLRFLLDRPDVKVILLPRNDRQSKVLQESWRDSIQNHRIIIPAKVVDGLNLIWFSDLVISGGGTMNREAAALGVPVYSIFRGPTGAVDKYLTNAGRLLMIEKADEIRKKVVLKRRCRQDPNFTGRGPAFKSIVDGIVSIAEHQELLPPSA